MSRDVDALTSATLKHLRERWWDDAFTTFVRDTVQPRAGKRILDVGCGTGTAEVKLSRLRLTQVQLVALDHLVERVREAQKAATGHNVSASFLAADASALPFADGSFDSAFCVAVLQHLRDVRQAVRELARVTRPGGRIVAVEPDNEARYFYSSSEAGMRAYEAAGQFFSGLACARGDSTDASVGPKLPLLFVQSGIHPLNVQLFPVSRAQLGEPPETLWAGRREAVQAALQRAPDESIRRLGQDYLKLLDRYAADAKRTGPAFVEIQHTMLFAAVGQRPDE
jgi:SAM-dependent methyltransferase